MAKKKKEEPKKPEPKQATGKWYSGLSQQDTFTASWLLYTRKDIRAQVQQALRTIKNEDALIKELIKIASEPCKNTPKIYDDHLKMYQTKTDWKALIPILKEQIAKGS